MKIRQIRNATMRIEFGDKCFLTDPWLQDVGTIPPFGPVHRIPNPTVPLPMKILDILKGVDAYIVTHIHPDHFDIEKDENGTIVGGRRLNKFVKVFVQNADDQKFIEDSGFVNPEILSESGTRFGNVELIKTSGIHGTKKTAGTAMGIIMRAENEKTLYIAGDTIYCRDVEQTLLKYRPAVVIANACAAYTPETGRLIMDGGDLVKIHQILPDAVIIASHMDAVNHAAITRNELKMQMQEEGIMEHIIIPNDGDPATAF